MPVKVVLMLKRRRGMTPGEFRAAYESGHSRLGLALFGHLWTGYRRNYLGPANSFAAETGTPTDATPTDVDDATQACPFDVITELVFADMAGLEEMNRIASIPENQRLLSEDEETLFDREACWTSLCDVVEEDLDEAVAGRA